MAEHLRGQVLGCSTECLHSGTILDTLLAQPEVRYLDVPVFVQHEVLQLCGKPQLVCPHPQALPPLVPEHTFRSRYTTFFSECK